MAEENRVGEFLRARRELVRPEDLGVPDLGRRRVPGLRREELAMLAGVSADYYVRLEQGRDRHPSEQVLDALACALRLDDETAAHLHELARPAPHRRRARARPERVRPSIQQLLDGWAHTPAFVLGPCCDVLASNALAGALHIGFTAGHNLLRTIFLDPDAREFHADWTRTARGSVATLRASAAPELDGPRLAELVGELSLKSDTFRRLWARHDVHRKTHATKLFHHPVVGKLKLNYTSFSIDGAPGQQLIVYHAQPYTPAAQALALLASITATDPPIVQLATSSPPDRTLD